MLKKHNLVTYICLLSTTLGFVALQAGLVEAGRTLIATTVSGFFGFSKLDNYYTPEIIFLTYIILMTFILYFSGQTTEVFSESIGIVYVAMGGFFGYITQSKEVE